MSKDRIIETLGESQLLLPGLLTEALSANDRVENLLMLLQSAQAAADGDGGMSDLREERLAERSLDPLSHFVCDSSKREDGCCRFRGPRSWFVWRSARSSRGSCRWTS